MSDVEIKDGEHYWIQQHGHCGICVACRVGDRWLMVGTRKSLGDEDVAVIAHIPCPEGR